MIWEALGSAALGLALAWAASYRFAERLPSRALVLTTGAAGAVFGAFITHSSLGPGHALATLAGAAVLTMALLSLLLRPSRGPRRSVAT
ncbi:hypothetical protein [Streptomyces sp. NPDC002851]